MARPMHPSVARWSRADGWRASPARRFIHDLCMSEQQDAVKLERLHRRARERGVARRSYALARALLGPPLRFWFRLRASGQENVPREGPAIIAPNHKSFLDAFFIAVALRRPVRYMAKVELFPGLLGWCFVRLGAFPVRRGESDREAMATARRILEQDGLVVIFPEGTRVEDRNALGSPHHGAGRLAFESGAPIVPAAIAGTERLWLGPLAKPRRVQVTFLPPIDPAGLTGREEPVSALIDEHVWPAVQSEYGRQLARPGLVLTALTALGIGAGFAARRHQRAQTRLLGVIAPGNVRRRAARSERLRRLRGLGRSRRQPPSA
jgi:1-acyl-sn-glycerol-3-phosphate acyltransferase